MLALLLTVIILHHLLSNSPLVLKQVGRNIYILDTTIFGRTGLIIGLYGVVFHGEDHGDV